MRLKRQLFYIRRKKKGQKEEFFQVTHWKFPRKKQKNSASQWIKKGPKK